MSKQPCRWGILGTARIARKNWKAIRNAENSTLVAVASRDPQRARQFIEECQADVPMPAMPAACGSYQELLDRKDIDAVYIPLPTGLRKQWVIQAAQAGKHVLCEKPCAISSADLKSMLDVCRSNGVQFMDGVMFMHSQRLPLLRQILDDGRSIGGIRRITSQFSFLASDEFIATNIRTSSALEPLGCLGDLGWYNIRFALWVMNEQLPQRVAGRVLAWHNSDAGAQVPMEFSGEMFFHSGESASFYCSFRTGNQQWANVSGTLGYLHVPDFVVPFYGNEVSFETNAPFLRVRSCCDFGMESYPRRLAVHEYASGTANAQETNMIRTFAQIVASGQLQPRWAEQALATQQVLDALLVSARQDSTAVRVVTEPSGETCAENNIPS
jgi:predicted dehydrogenase